MQAVIRDVSKQFVPLIVTVEVAAQDPKDRAGAALASKADNQIPWIERLADY